MMLPGAIAWMTLVGVASAAGNASGFGLPVLWFRWEEVAERPLGITLAAQGSGCSLWYLSASYPVAIWSQWMAMGLVITAAGMNTPVSGCAGLLAQLANHPGRCIWNHGGVSGSRRAPRTTRQSIVSLAGGLQIPRDVAPLRHYISASVLSTLFMVPFFASNLAG